MAEIDVSFCCGFGLDLMWRRTGDKLPNRSARVKQQRGLSRRGARIWWVRPWLNSEERLTFRHYHRLMEELRKEDAAEHNRYFAATSHRIAKGHTIKNNVHMVYATLPWHTVYGNILSKSDNAKMDKGAPPNSSKTPPKPINLFWWPQSSGALHMWRGHIRYRYVISSFCLIL